MPFERQLWVAFLFLGLLASAAGPAAAQDYLGAPQASDAFVWPRYLRNYALAPVASELSPYLRSGEEDGAALTARPFLRQAPAAPPSRLILFTRLAGMFMGRVSPWSVGDMRICFKLDIQ